MSPPTLLVAVFNEAQRWVLPEVHIDRLRAGLNGRARVEQVRTRATLIERINEVELLMGLPLAESQLADLSGSLRFVQFVSPYAESLAPIARVLEHGARVAGTAPIRAAPVAEHAVALLFTLLRGVDRAILAQSAHQWSSEPIAHAMRDLADATVGLIGLGDVGRAIAHRLAPFGCEIVATRRGDPGPDDDDADDAPVARLLGAESVDELLGRSDIIILADDRAGRARPILDRALFESLSPGSLLINVASGSAFREGELLRALRRGRLAGVALDAFDHRPLAPTNSLWNTPNVLITPSVAAASPSTWRRAVDVMIDNISRLDEGRPVRDEITPAMLAQPAAP